MHRLNIQNAGIMIRDLPENSVWSLAGIGDQQLKMNSLAIAIGGGVESDLRIISGTIIQEQFLPAIQT